MGGILVWTSGKIGEPITQAGNYVSVGVLYTNSVQNVYRLPHCIEFTVAAK